jgi:hypothetical protein
VTQPTPPTSELLRELAATHGDVLEATLRRGYAPTQPTPQVGPHDLVISAGDCEFYVMCSCGQSLTEQVRPDRLVSGFAEDAQRWERHVMAEHRNCDCGPCSW